jgi:hypothetical protein
MISYPVISPLTTIAMTGLGDRHHPEYAIDITGIRNMNNKTEP